MVEKGSVTLPLKSAYPFLAKNGCSSEMEKIRDSREKFGSYQATLKRAKIVALLEEKRLLDRFIHEAWAGGPGEYGNRIRTHTRSQ